MHALMLLAGLALGGTLPYEDQPTDPLEPPNAHLAAWGTNFVATWTSATRELAFSGADAGTPRRGPELWANVWFADGGLAAPYGLLLAEAGLGESFTQPRVAAVGADVWFLWRVAKSTQAGTSVRAMKCALPGGTCTLPVTLSGFGVEQTALELEVNSTGVVLATWETPTAFLRARVSPTGPVQGFWVKSAGTSLRPTLAPAGGGFRLGWAEGSAYSWLDPTVDGGMPVSNPLPGTASAGFMLGGAVAEALVITPVGAGTSLSLRTPSGTATTMSLASLPPLMGAIGADGTRWAVHGGEDPTLGLELVALDGAGTPRAALVDTILMPRAVAAGPARTALLANFGPAWEFRELLANASLMPSVLGSTEAAAASSEQYPTASWSPGTNTWTLITNQVDGPYSSVSVVASDGGAPPTGQIGSFTVRKRLVTPGLSFEGTMTLESPGPGLSAQLPDGGSLVRAISSAALLAPDTVGAFGNVVALAWNPRTNHLGASWGTPQNQVRTERLGRCGAFAGGRFWLPLLDTNAGLSLLAFDDTTTPSSTTGTLYGLVGSAGVEPARPCLAAKGPALAVAWSAAQKLSVATSTSSGMGPGIPRTGSFATGDAGVIDPVLAPLDGGWLVAWEAPVTGLGGSALRAMTIADDLSVSSPVTEIVGPGVDRRGVFFAPGPNGLLLLGWSEFDEVRGRVVVQTRVIAMPSATATTDAGMVAPDAGLVDAGLPETLDGGIADAGLSDGGVADAGPDDGGLEPVDAGASDGGKARPDAGPGDGGKIDPDAGLADAGTVDEGEPIAFGAAACGCAADAGSALALLGVVLLRRRRRG